MNEYEQRFEKCVEIKKSLTLKQYCNCLYSCLQSDCGSYPEYCENCAFEKCCIMKWSPDTMLFDILSGYEYLPDTIYDRDVLSKSRKYNRIVQLVNEVNDECNS